MDGQVCAAHLEGGLWEQGSSGEAPTLVTRLVSVDGGIDTTHYQSLCNRSSSLKSGFKKPGKNAMNTCRAVLITGPPGIGKTTSAHLCAKLEGFTPIELNASDARSKKLIEVSLG